MPNLSYHDIDGQEELMTSLYDLEGYLVIEDVLSSEQVDELNAIVDDALPPFPDDWRDGAEEQKLHAYNLCRFGMAGGSYPSGPGFLSFDQALVDLIDHPLIMQIMRMQMGDCFRLDRVFGMRMQRDMPAGRLHSDYGASEPFTGARPGQRYPQPAYQALHGFGVAALNLADSGPETGGLCLIPSSHNSQFKLPMSIRNDEFTDVVVCPKAPAGSMVFFSEATTHGTRMWTAEHERRTLLYKYCASQLTWSRTRVQAPEGSTLTGRQSRLLEEPAGAKWFFDSLFDDEAPRKTSST